MTALHPPAPPALRHRPRDAWRTLSAAMTAQIPAIAGRDDLTVTCAPGAGQGAPACFLPAIAGIEVDGNLPGVDPATADPASPADRERYPAIWGALTHEVRATPPTPAGPPPAGHKPPGARPPTCWRSPASRPPRSPAAPATAAGCAPPSASSSSTTSPPPAPPPAAPAEAGSAAALILARESAGILEAAETAPSPPGRRKAIGAEAPKRLRQPLAGRPPRRRRRPHHGPARPPLVPHPRHRPRRRPARPRRDRPVRRRWSPSGEAIAAISAAVEADFTPPPPFPPGKEADREAEKNARTDAGRAAREVFGAATPRGRLHRHPRAPRGGDRPPPAA